MPELDSLNIVYQCIQNNEYTKYEDSPIFYGSLEFQRVYYGADIDPLEQCLDKYGLSDDVILPDTPAVGAYYQLHAEVSLGPTFKLVKISEEEFESLVAGSGPCESCRYYSPSRLVYPHTPPLAPDVPLPEDREEATCENDDVGIFKLKYQENGGIVPVKHCIYWA